MTKWNYSIKINENFTEKFKSSYMRHCVIYRWRMPEYHGRQQYKDGQPLKIEETIYPDVMVYAEFGKDKHDFQTLNKLKPDFQKFLDYICQNNIDFITVRTENYNLELRKMSHSGAYEERVKTWHVLNIN